jgi:hypothetical protein
MCSTRSPGQQRLLLFDEGVGGGVGQVLDGLAAQDCQLASAGVLRAELAIGFRQVVADQVEQQRFDFGVCSSSISRPSSRSISA